MKLVLQILRFGCIGAFASAVHLAVVSACVPLGLAPWLANLVGFGVAFQASYHGHRSWTFRGRDNRGSRGRMFLVALGGLAFNESAYLLMLRHAALDYRLSLAIVLALQAALTFVAARCWVFSVSRGALSSRTSPSPPAGVRFPPPA